MGGMGQDGLLDLLAPAWQAAIGVCVVVFVVLAVRSLARRGWSRMNRAVAVSGVAVIGLVVMGLLMAAH